jgi:hypothetical protein
LDGPFHERNPAPREATCQRCRQAIKALSKYLKIVTLLDDLAYPVKATPLLHLEKPAGLLNRFSRSCQKHASPTHGGEGDLRLDDMAICFFLAAETKGNERFMIVAWSCHFVFPAG